jgi:hypothetical protein
VEEDVFLLFVCLQGLQVTLLMFIDFDLPHHLVAFVRVIFVGETHEARSIEIVTVCNLLM